MKTSFISLFFIFQSLVLIAQSESDTLLLLPEFGKQYLYEIKESKYIQTKKGRFNPFEKIKELKIKYDKNQTEEGELLLVTLEKNIALRPNEVPLQIKDYKYPGFKGGFYEAKYSDFYESLFFHVVFKYEFDFETSKIKLTNRDEILIKIHEVLNEKGYEERAKRRQVRLFNEDGIPLFTELVQSIYRIPVSNFNSPNFKSEEYETKFEVLKPYVEYSQKRFEYKTGLYSRKVKANQELRYLINFNSVHVDSLKHRIRGINNEYHYLLSSEKSISLKSLNPIGNSQVLIRGTVPKQINNKVSISWLKKPFGTNFHQQTIFLDENNSFQFETDLQHAQLFYIQFGQNYSSENINNIPLIVLYVEPGSEIRFNATGDTFPWNIEFSGDFQIGNKMIYEFRKKHPVFLEVLNQDFLQWYTYKVKSKDFEAALRDFEEYFESYKNKVEQNAWNFIRQEVEAQLVSAANEFLYRRKRAETNLYPLYFQDKEVFNWGLIENKLKTFNINLNYNQYGIQSRLCAKSILTYNFALAKKIENIFGFPDFSSFGGTISMYHDYSYNIDIPLQAEFAKTVLSGQALYLAIADNLYRQKINSSKGESQAEIWVQNKADEYFELMLRLSNDDELNHEIESIIATHLKWKNEEYVPDTKFFKPEGEQVTLNDFLGSKPTIFYVSRSWGAERYYFDDLSVENPEINYVFIVEGSNFDEWKNYLKAAEPKAHQLFFLNNKFFEYP